MNRFKLSTATIVLFLIVNHLFSSPLPGLQVDKTGHFLITENGEPFFWLGDTSWKLFQKSTSKESELQPAVETYFKTRAKQRFSVIQSCILMDIDEGNAYGHDPFVNWDFSKPLTKKGELNDFWDHADFLIDQAEKHGLYMALLPVWINNVPEDHPLVQDPNVAYAYGQFLGQRYKDRKHIIWIMGGDPYSKGKDADNPRRVVLARAMAEGITDGVNSINDYDGYADFSTTLMSYHPQGRGTSSSWYLHDELWLDFNMIQSSSHHNIWNYETVNEDYNLKPAKPTMESEAAYEYSKSLYELEPNTKDQRISPWEARKAAYWGVFAGGFGHTYGHRSFIHWMRKGETRNRGADTPWYEMLDAPAANQLKHLNKLMLSRPFLTRVPDQSLLAYPQGNQDDHIQATRDGAYTYAMFYTPLGKSITVDLTQFNCGFVQGAWYSPRDGSYKKIRRYPCRGMRTFFAPTRGEEGDDWVLILDNPEFDYPYE